MTTSPITAGSPMLSDELFKLDLHMGDPLRGAVAESGDPLQANEPAGMSSAASGSGANLVRPGDVLILPASTQSGEDVGTSSLPYRAEGMPTNSLPFRAEGGAGEGITEPTSAGTQGTGGGDILALPIRAEGGDGGNLLSNAQRVVESARAMTQQFAQPVADADQPGSPIPQGHFHT